MKKCVIVTMLGLVIIATNFAFGAESRHVFNFLAFESFHQLTKNQYLEYLTEESFRELTDNDIASLIADVEPDVFKEQNELADKIPCKNISALETRFIGQKEFSISGANDQKYNVATTGVGPCVAIGIYNPVLKRALLAHCDALTHLDTMNLLIMAMFGNTNEKQAKFFLVSQDNVNLSRFHSRLKSMGFPDDMFTVIVTNSSSSVGMDARNGTFFCYDYDHNVHKDSNLDDRQNLIAQSILINNLNYIK